MPDIEDVDLETGYAFEQEDWTALRENASRTPIAVMAAEIPDEVDPRPWHRIENQGNMGSCRGHSLASGLERLYFIATGGQVTHFSRHFAYIETQRLDGLIGSDQGSTIFHGLELARDVGVPQEEYAAYPDPVKYRTTYQDANGKSMNRDMLLKLAEPFKGRSYVKVQDYAHARQLIGTGWYIDLGCMWPVEIDGKATVQSFKNHGRGGHATAGLGYLKDGRLVWANSHSSRYGDSGWYYWTETAFNEVLRDRYTACYAVNDMARPQPRRPNHKGMI